MPSLLDDEPELPIAVAWVTRALNDTAIDGWSGQPEPGSLDRAVAYHGGVECEEERAWWRGVIREAVAAIREGSRSRSAEGAHDTPKSFPTPSRKLYKP